MGIISLFWSTPQAVIHIFQSKHISGSRVVIQHCLQKASPTPNLKINRLSFVATFALLDHLWIAICSFRTFATIIPSLITSVTYFQPAILSRQWVIIHVTKMSADILKGKVSSRSSYISVSYNHKTILKFAVNARIFCFAGDRTLKLKLWKLMLWFVLPTLSLIYQIG